MKVPTHITIKLDAEEFRELWMYAAHRHVGGQFPVNAFAKEAVFSYMAKYPIPDAKRPLLVSKYQEVFPDARAVQPDAPMGN